MSNSLYTAIYIPMLCCIYQMYKLDELLQRLCRSTMKIFFL